MSFQYPLVPEYLYQNWDEGLTFLPEYSLPIRAPAPSSSHIYQQLPSPESSVGYCTRRDSMVAFPSGSETAGHWSSTGSESNSSRSPLASFPFLKNLTGEKKTTRDGQTPKRRGPKPDSKPALTRRQELNRQAQRTHRERKEMYIKALEQEVMRLRDTIVSNTRDRDTVMEENRRLREILAAHGIQFELKSPNGFDSSNNYTASSSGSMSTGYDPNSASTGYTSPPNASGSSLSQMPTSAGSMPTNGQHNMLDYDGIGIDFVLTLERPCMDHMQMLLVRSATGADEDISGHALMASCPPEKHIHEKASEPYPLQMPEGLAMPDLMKLLDLSNRLPLNGEITPIMAWAMVLGHERLPELSKPDLLQIKEELLAKVHCYGFGAVLEEFEVQDALSKVLVGRPGDPNDSSSA